MFDEETGERESCPLCDEKYCEKHSVAIFDETFMTCDGGGIYEDYYEGYHEQIHAYFWEKLKSGAKPSDKADYELMDLWETILNDFNEDIKREGIEDDDEDGKDDIFYSCWNNNSSLVSHYIIDVLKDNSEYVSEGISDDSGASAMIKIYDTDPEEVAKKLIEVIKRELDKMFPE